MVQRLEKLKDDPGKEDGKLQPSYYWWINRSATTLISHKVVPAWHLQRQPGMRQSALKPVTSDKSFTWDSL